MAKKKERVSLMDLKRTDEIEEKMSNPTVGNGKAKKTETVLVSNIEKTPIDDALMADYEKLSVSIPIETFEILQDISRERRRARKKHTMSQMVREAISLWLEHRSQTNSI